MRPVDASAPAAIARQQRERALLAAAFEIDISDVISDGQAMLTWSGPWDDALVAVCRAYGWDAEMGVMYLAHLKRQFEPHAGPIPSAWTAR
jgi:hypothetical protein